MSGLFARNGLQGRTLLDDCRLSVMATNRDGAPADINVFNASSVTGIGQQYTGCRRSSGDDDETCGNVLAIQESGSGEPEGGCLIFDFVEEQGVEIVNLGIADADSGRGGLATVKVCR